MFDLEKMSLRELYNLDSFLKVKSFTEYCIKSLLLLRDEISSGDINQYLTEYVHYRQNLPIYQELFRSYKLFMDTLSYSVLDLIGDKNILTIIIILSELIKRGILSYPGNFRREFNVRENASDYYLPPDYLGMYVLVGHGVCRHQNAFVNDFLRHSNILSDNILSWANGNGVSKKEGTKNNHLITGYVSFGGYFLVDSYSSIFSFRNNGQCYKDLFSSKVVYPDFDQSAIMFPNNVAGYKKYSFVTLEESVVIGAKNEALDVLKENGYAYFEKFRNDNIDLLTRIYTLALLELERTEENEGRKRKY